MKKTLLILMLSCLTCAAAADSGYTLSWWADGFRGHSADGRRLVNVQTDHYGASIDVEKASIVRLGPIAGPPGYAAAAVQGNTVVDALPTAEMRITARVGETEYTCTRAAANVKDQMNYPVRLIEGGRWLHRWDILGLEFTRPNGPPLEAEGRLEICAWPNHLVLSVELTPTANLENVALALDLGLGGKIGHSELTTPGKLAKGMPISFQSWWWPDGGTQTAISQIHVADAQAENAEIPVHLDNILGAEVVALPSRQWDMAKDLDHLDRFPVTLKNDTEFPATVPLVFEFKDGFQGVTGMCPMLRDAEGNPCGIPVQISKDWHRQAERRMLYEGAWFQGVTEITVPPHGEWKGEYAVAYARWGGVPSVSHSQLSLVGYGGNQRWDECAIGSFGESICYDADVGLNRSMIDDVRPLMVTGMNGGQWIWTHNVGGGDFLVYAGESGEKQYLSCVHVAYVSQGPNLSDVIYAGNSADGKIAARVEVQTPRCDDINRSYHHVRYDVREAAKFTRLAFYQLGADNYNDHQFTRIARGNRDGLTEEWDTERGGKRYLRGPMVCDGADPWVALLGGIRSPKLEKGAWADRALVIRSWKARLGGRDVPQPSVAIYGTENGIPSANVEIVPPAGVTELAPGDYVDAEIELLILPQHAEDYYGPNAAFRADLEANGGTWRTVQRLAKGNDLSIQSELGEVVARLPIAVNVGKEDAAEITIIGGAGYLPITFLGLRRASEYVLEVDNALLDQHVHGNDFWQTEFDTATSSYAQTYNVSLDGRTSHHITYHPK